MYGILRNSTLSETNKYSNCLRKNLIPGVKHTSFLLLYTTQPRKKHVLKHKGQKKFEITSGKGMYGYRLVAE